MIGKKGILPSYTATELGHPAIPLKKDLLYLCAISGGGQGLTGSEENRICILEEVWPRLSRINF